MELNLFLKELKRHKGQLSRQQLKSIRGQAISGNIELARKGLENIKNGSKEK